ncbi:sensor histidine kinase [Pontibacter chitinilyticus]|uniref:sensor histidine kinase n=1 Tax=Pontibacter chitinilyticus TaxID=2674989 RepID=UPI00321C3818
MIRLLQRTNRWYVLSSAVLFLVAGAVLVQLFAGIIEEEASEQLLSIEQRITRRLEQGQPIPQLPPVIQITRLSDLRQESLVLKDTAFFDELENEVETFRQVASVRHIHGSAYRIVLRQMIVDRGDSMPTIGLSLGIVMLLLLLFLAVMNRAIYRQLWRPFYQSLEALRNFSVYQSAPLQLGSTKTTEFAELNAALAKLTEKTRSDFRALKEFSENASHEMQTPLAVIKARLDELLQEAELREEQATSIQAAHAAVKKLSRLNQTLLLLTKIENRQFIYTEAVDMAAIIQAQLNDSEDFILGKNLQVRCTTASAPVLTANPALVETLVSNLLRNAIRHNLPGGFVAIDLNKDRLRITNSGRPLACAPEKLFERFSKADASSHSLGLGLAIVQTICTLYGWRVRYEAAQDVHSLWVAFAPATAADSPG